MSALDDSRQRDKALDISLSCCVQAPAGSGKTELLTQRMLKLLGLCQRPEEILAITFTRKAAAEMRNRVLDILAEASVVDDGQLASLPKHRRQTLELARVVLDRDAKLGWSLQANTSRLRINTIDSFNQFLVAKLPVTSALGMMPGIAENPRELFREAVTDLLKSLDSTSHLGRELEVLLTHLNNQWSTLESLLCGLLGKRDQWLPHILGMRGNSKTSRAYMEHTLGNIVESALADLDKALCPYLSRLLPLYAFAADNLAASGNSALADCALADRLPPQRVAAFGQWRTCMALLLREDNGKPALRKTVTADQGFPAQSAPGSKTDKALRKQYKSDMVELLQALAGDEALRPSLETFFFLPEPSFNDRQWRVLESLIIILPQLVSHLSLVFAQHQQVGS